MRLSGLIGLAMLGGGFLLPNCGGDDDDDDVGTGGTAGSGGRGGSSGRGGSAGSANGGRSGSSTGGSSGSGQAGDDSAGSAGEAAAGGSSGSPGSGGSSGEAGAPGGAGAGAGGTPGAGGSAGESGAAGAGGEPGNPDPASTACSDFPETVTLGETIQVNTYGAVLCTATTPSCRLTTNTYSDGTNPCADADSTAYFQSNGTVRTLRLLDTWHITSTTAGTIDTQYDYYMSEIPASTSVSVVIESPDGDTYSLVFEFGAGREFTLTSFAETT